jgi:hypothetical protein
MIVDDEIMVTTTMKAYLTENLTDVELVCANSAIDALELLRRYSFSYAYLLLQPMPARPFMPFGNK